MAHKRVILDDLPLHDVKEGIIVVNDPWYMDLFLNFRMYFFNPDKGKEPKPLYLFFYETLKEQFGKKNKNARHIRYVARAKEIIYNVRPSEFHIIPELQPLTKEPYYWDYISLNNEQRHVILLGEVGELRNPLPLRGDDPGVNPKILVGRKVSLLKVLNAEYIEDILA